MLSVSLARHRRSAGLTQPQLAAIAGVSVTTIGHAETGRLWQSRDFWERADRELNAGGDLLARHDAYRAATAVSSSVDPNDTTSEFAVSLGVTEAKAAVPGPVCITVTWANGAVTTVYPPREISPTLGDRSSSVP